MRIEKFLVGVMTIVFGFNSTVLAVGGGAIGNEVPSARTVGQGYVGVAAQNEDPSVAYINPAGLTLLKGTHITLGGAWENFHGNYEADSGVKTKMRSVDAFVPNASVSHSFMDGKLGTGLSLQSPYGLETHWPGNSQLRYIATDSKLHMIILSPAVAYKVHPMVSVGVGADYVNAFDASLEKKVNVNNVNFALGVPTAGAPDANSELSGSGANWGYHAGVVVEPNEKHSVGVVYHSKIKLTLKGSTRLTGLSGASAALFGGSNYETSAYTDFFLPQNIQFGYAYKPTEKWMLEVDTAWYDWTSSRDLNIRYAETNANRLAILNNSGNGNPIAQNWRAAWSVATGVNYKWSEKLQLRSGFWYVPHAAPESTFNPSFMDLTRYGITIGSGYALTTNLTLDVAYNATFFHSRHITNTVGTATTGDPSTNVDGKFTNFTNIVATNLTYRWGN